MEFNPGMEIELAVMEGKGGKGLRLIGSVAIDQAHNNWPIGTAVVGSGERSKRSVDQGLYHRVFRRETQHPPGIVERDGSWLSIGEQPDPLLVLMLPVI